MARIGSVVIPAHNEANVIGRCLSGLFSNLDPAQLDVVVVCNGCTDETAERARTYGYPVRVLELAEGSKAAALRAGDQAAAGFPRIYLDADVVLAGSAARALCERLDSGAVAARPPIEYDASRSSLLVRRYYRARARVPAVLGSLWGAGVYGLSEHGRSRFDSYPDLVGDDLWADRHFRRDEIEVVDCTPVRVAAPRHTQDLVRILMRTYRGNAEQRPVPGDAPPVPRTTQSTVRDLGRLLTSQPGSALDVATYAGFALTGRLALSFAPATSSRWERDESSRAV
jgi:glycosyltransferase involved in cell wall biosynthesis